MSGFATFGLEPDKALEYFQNKGLNLTYNYEEMMHEAHHKAFTVAKVTRLDILEDINESLYNAMKSGATFDEWKKELKPTLAKKGWYGTKEITNPKTGETKTIRIGSRRLRTIYNTNMRVAYSVGRYKQMMGYKKAVYWRYTSALLENTRTSHASKHGMIKHRDDPWWSINYPPNDWNCKCSVSAYTKSELNDKGWSEDTSPHESIASSDWAYDVGAGSKVAKLSKVDLDKSLEKLPTILKNSKYQGLSDEAVKKKFYNDLGIKSGDTYIDKVGDPTIIDDALFHTMGFAKTNKKDRHLYVEEFAKLISDPDEIYLEKESLRNASENYAEFDKRLVKKFIRYYKDEKGNKRALMALFEYLKDKTQGVSLYFLDTNPTVEKKRVEKLIYQKEGLK